MDKQKKEPIGALSDVARKLAPVAKPQAPQTQAQTPQFSAVQKPLTPNATPGLVGQVQSAQGKPLFNATQQALTPNPTPGLVGQVAKVAPGLVKPAEQAAPQAQAQRSNVDPFNSPTGFVNFGRYFGANAQAAEDTANALNARVQGAGNKAASALENAYSNYQGQVQGAADRAIRERGPNATGKYAGPSEFNPGQDVTQDFQEAREQRDALGSDAGVQALIGPNAGWLGAALTRQAGREEFAQTQQEGQALDTALGEFRQRGREDADRARRAVDDYFGAVQADQTVPESRRTQDEIAQANETIQSEYQKYLDEQKSIERQHMDDDLRTNSNPMTFDEWKEAEGWDF